MEGGYTHREIKSPSSFLKFGSSFSSRCPLPLPFLMSAFRERMGGRLRSLHMPLLPSLYPSLPPPSPPFRLYTFAEEEGKVSEEEGEEEG